MQDLHRRPVGSATVVEMIMTMENIVVHILGMSANDADSTFTFDELDVARVEIFAVVEPKVHLVNSVGKASGGDHTPAECAPGDVPSDQTILRGE